MHGYAKSNPEPHTVQIKNGKETAEGFFKLPLTPSPTQRNKDEKGDKN